MLLPSRNIFWSRKELCDFFIGFEAFTQLNEMKLSAISKWG
jgi:hypothetical protein